MDERDAIRAYIFERMAQLNKENTETTYRSLREWNRVRIEELEDVINFIETLGE